MRVCELVVRRMIVICKVHWALLNGETRRCHGNCKYLYREIYREKIIQPQCLNPRASEERR